MKHIIGKAICWLLHRHKWRRLRKGECDDRGLVPGNTDYRICDRCGIIRKVRVRKEKPSALSADMKVTP